MTLIENHEYRFPTHLLPTLINSDPIIDNRPVSSGKTEQDCLNDFLNKLKQLKKEYHATDYVVECDSDSYFSYNNCLYDNVGCDVTDITVYFLK